MGLNAHGLTYLCHARSTGLSFDRVLTIGRLDLNVRPPRARQLLTRHGFAGNGLETARHAEPIFQALGASTVDSLDCSDYEAASIVHDLNAPLPEQFQKTYDLVYDGGTLEHVFNVPVALKSYMELARVGGSIIIQTMANNWLGHGFYQFSPDLFYRVFAPENGYRIERLILHENFARSPWYEVPDPQELGHRTEASNAWHGLNLLVHARRDRDIPIFATPPQQSDYARQWAKPKPNGTPRHAPVPAYFTLAYAALDRFPSTARMLNRWLDRRRHRRLSVHHRPKIFRRWEG